MSTTSNFFQKNQWTSDWWSPPRFICHTHSGHTNSHRGAKGKGMGHTYYKASVNSWKLFGNLRTTPSLMLSKTYIYPLKTHNIRISPTSFRPFCVLEATNTSFYKFTYATTFMLLQLTQPMLNGTFIKKPMESVQIAIQQTLSWMSVRNEFAVRNLVTSSRAFWNLWVTMETICGSLASDAINCLSQPHTVCH